MVKKMDKGKIEKNMKIPKTICTICPKCGKEVVYEQCYNRDPVGMPLFWRFLCKNCSIASYDGKDWWEKTDICKPSIHRDDAMIGEKEGVI